MLLVVLEVVLGIMLLVGVRLKETVWALALMILFFTLELESISIGGM